MVVRWLSIHQVLFILRSFDFQASIVKAQVAKKLRKKKKKEAKKLAAGDAPANGQMEETVVSKEATPGGKKKKKKRSAEDTENGEYSVTKCHRVDKQDTFAMSIPLVLSSNSSLA